MAHQFDLLVLGAGITGVCTAYWAQQAGLSVCLLDAREGPALETSYANGGQISVSHAGPWATPQALAQALSWLTDPSAPLRLKPHMDPRQWAWLAGFARQCTPARVRFNAAQAVRLSAYSRDCLHTILDQEPIAYGRRRTGILHVYRKAESLKAANAMAALMRDNGCDRREMDLAEMIALEPALAQAAPKLVSGTYTTGDETGDARRFAAALCARITAQGGATRFGWRVLDAHESRDGVIVRARSEVGEAHAAAPHRKDISLRAHNIVICLGVGSAPLLARWGVHVPIYPVKGYSLSIPIRDGDTPPITALIDDENKVVYANLHTHLRVAGMAELCGEDRMLDPVRVARLKALAQDLFPDAGDYDAAEAWTGLRPMTPSSLPFIQRSPRHTRIWLNTGHGALGWTMAAGSGRLIVDNILGREPGIAYRRVA